MSEALTTVSPSIRRVRRWPTALSVFLLTSLVAAVIVRYVLPTCEWWVSEDPDVAKDSAAGGRYIETVLYSKLSDSSKVNLILAFATKEIKNEIWDEADMRTGAIRLSPSIARSGSEYTDRYAVFLQDHIILLCTRVLADTSAPSRSHTNALALMVLVIERTSSRTYSTKGGEMRPGSFRAVELIAKASPVLVDYLSSPKVDHRRFAALAFAHIGLPMHFVKNMQYIFSEQIFPTPELIARLSDPDKDVRKWSALALGYSPPQAVNDSVAQLLTSFETDTDNDVRIAAARSLGLCGHRFRDIAEPPPGTPDARPVLAKYLRTPRVTKTQKKEFAPESLLRTEVIVALSLLEPTPETVDAIIAQVGKPQPIYLNLDNVLMAATWTLGGGSGHPRWHPMSAGTVLLQAMRDEWARLRRGNQFLNSDNIHHTNTTIATQAIALLGHPESARTAVVDLIWLIPLTGNLSAFMPEKFQLLPDRHFPEMPLREINYAYGQLPSDWLTTGLEKIGPPAKSELPGLRKLLDTNGEGLTASSHDIEQMQMEAAKALLRDAVSGAVDPGPILEGIVVNPSSHKRLAEAAQAILDKSKVK